MKYLFYPFWILWRVWFYTLMLFTILLMTPFLFLFISNEKYYPRFWKMIRVWSRIMIFMMGFRLKIQKDQEIERDGNYMFCPNHTSFFDIFKLIVMSKNPIVFVGKKELTKIPIFGYFYKKVAIVVDRSNAESRKKVYADAKYHLKLGRSIVIFPEGIVPSEDVVLAPFKNGAFSLAIEHQIPIVPQVYYDGKRLFSWNIFKGHPGVFRLKQLKFVETKGLAMGDKDILREKIFKLIEEELLNDEKYMIDTNSIIKN